MSSHTHYLESQHSTANPDTPPPEYSIHVPNQQGSPSSQHSLTGAIPGSYPRERSLFSSSSDPQFVPPSSFGPTPLMQSQPTLGLLPYYDPHSPYSIQEATSRARWRFFGAAFWVIGLITCLALLGVLRGLLAARTL